MVRLIIAISIITSFFSIEVLAQKIIAGPMLGYSEMRESIVWLQLDSEAYVKVEYIQKDSTDNKLFSDEYISKKEHAYTLKIIIDRLLPGKYYDYYIYVNNKKVKLDYDTELYAQELWHWRTDPPNFKFAMGSGNWTYDPQFEDSIKYADWKCDIYEEIYKKNPDFMLWLGDNVYYRPEDWNTRTGMIYRNAFVRSKKSLQPLLANTHHYAIWDDHDYGPNNSNGAFWNKETARDVFQLFFPNPTFGFDDFGGITTSFEWADVHFFLLDNRWERTPNERKTGEREILGEKQVQWLVDNLKRSLATFKVVVVGGQFLNQDAVFENHSAYPEERQKIIDLIDIERIEGVVFITGDRHYTELTKIKRDRTLNSHKLPLIDFTVSPLCSGVASSGSGLNIHQVDGTEVLERNFGVIEVSGTRKDRVMKFIVYDEFGELIWEREININELKYK